DQVAGEQEVDRTGAAGRALAEDLDDLLEIAQAPLQVGAHQQRTAIGEAQDARHRSARVPRAPHRVHPGRSNRAGQSDLPCTAMEARRVRVLVSGRVQGVCYRASTAERAVERGLTGW